MKLPAGSAELTIAFDMMSRGPYPPAGFLPVWDAELGNGDYFGLYWPLGREQQEPIVCEMYHDEGRLIPAFSDAAIFRTWLKLNDGDRGDTPIDDPAFAPSSFAAAKVCIAHGQVEQAISYLEQTCASVSEVSEYWLALATQRRRIGDQDGSVDAALSAFRSGWHFGKPSNAVLQILRHAQGAERCVAEPLVKRSDEFTMKYGGEKVNRNYDLLKECIDEYFSIGSALHALQLYQNYAFMMNAETTAFQERYRFDLVTWQIEFSNLCLHHLQDGRTTLK